MSGLCQDAYGQPWNPHLPYALWHAVVNGPMRYGRLDLDATHLARLRELADACDGWIISEAQEPTPLIAWQDLYSTNVDLVKMDNLS